MNVSAEWAIRAEVLCMVLEEHYPDIRKDLVNLNDDQIEEMWDDASEAHDSDLYDAMRSFRTDGEAAPDLWCDNSRHYESERVAGSTPFGWVSWIYWSGGGKHGNPEEIDWLPDAYFVNVVEKEVVRTERKFTKKGEDE